MMCCIDSYKWCNKCNGFVSFGDFTKNKSRQFGLGYWCKSCASDYAELYRENNKDKIKQYFKDNYVRLLEYNRQYNKTNSRHKKYREKHGDEINKKKRIRRQTDPGYRLNCNVSCEIRNSIIGQKKGRKWQDLVGYTLEDLKEHLEKQFKPGMTWDNYGRNGWHLDHIIPVSLFNIDGPQSKGFKKCWSLDNLQPLWEKENIRKNNKIFS